MSTLRQMADYFAAQHPPLPPPAIADCQPGVLARGQALVTQGDPAARRSRPAPRCHGPSFTGMEPAIPALLGLRAQLHQRPTGRLALWHAHGGRAGLHADSSPASLTENDVTALAAWLVVAARCPPTRPQCRTGSLHDAARLAAANRTERGERHAQLPTLLAAVAARGATAHRRVRRRRPGRSAGRARASISRVPGIASPAIRPGGTLFAGGSPCRRRSARSIPPTSRLTARPASATGRPINSTARCMRAIPGWRSDLSGDAVRLLHEGDARGQRRHLRLSADRSRRCSSRTVRTTCAFPSTIAR